MVQKKGVIVSQAGEVPGYLVAMVMMTGLVVNAFISPLLTILIGMGMNTVTITFWRLFVVGLTLLPFILFKKESRNEVLHLRGHEIPNLALYCFTKTCGFLLYAEALRAGAQAFTVSILTNVTPIWMVVFLFIFFKEKTPWQSLIGIGICLMGIFYVGSENIAQLGGDVLSVVFGMLCAMSSAINTLSGRSLRQKMSFTTLMGVSYFASSILAFLYALYVGSGFHVPSEALLVLAILSWGCTLIGHSTSIWAVKYVNPVTLSLINLCSPFFTAVTAFVMLGQVPKSTMIVGALIVVSGLVLKTLADNYVQRRRSSPPLEDEEEMPRPEPEAPATEPLAAELSGDDAALS